MLRALTAAELRAAAEVIVLGKVLSTRTVAGGGRIETEARVRVLEAWRGRARRTLRVRVPGGAIDGRRLIVPGAPSFARGERVLLFLYRDGGAWRPVGLFQGVWRGRADDPATVLASDAGGAALLAPARGRAAVERRSWSVAELVGGEAQR